HTPRRRTAPAERRSVPSKSWMTQVTAPDSFDDPRLLIFGQFGVDRQRQRLGGGRLGRRERTAVIAEAGKALLEVERHRIVHLGPDAAVGQVGPHAVAVDQPYHKLVV